MYSIQILTLATKKLSISEWLHNLSAQNLVAYGSYLPHLQLHTNVLSCQPIAPLGSIPISTFHWNHKLLHGEHMLTSVIFRFGSGEMTVLPVKSTRFPERFPRNLPCFPFKRCTKPRSGLPDVCCSVRATGVSLLMYNDTWDWRRSQVSWKWWKATFRTVTNQLQ